MSFAPQAHRNHPVLHRRVQIVRGSRGSRKRSRAPRRERRRREPSANKPLMSDFTNEEFDSPSPFLRTTRARNTRRATPALGALGAFPVKKRPRGWMQPRSSLVERNAFADSVLSHCLTVFSLSHCLTASLSSHCLAVSLSHCLLTVSLSHCLTVSLSSHCLAVFSRSHCLTVSLSSRCLAVSLSHCLTVSHIVPLVHCLAHRLDSHTVSLSHCLTVSLSHCLAHRPTRTLSRTSSGLAHCLTVLLSRCLTVSLFLADCAGARHPPQACPT
eukprot:1184383-Prorocentrum_minimum.AAC.3